MKLMTASFVALTLISGAARGQMSAITSSASSGSTTLCLSDVTGLGNTNCSVGTSGASGSSIPCFFGNANCSSGWVTVPPKELSISPAPIPMPPEPSGDFLLYPGGNISFPGAHLTVECTNGEMSSPPASAMKTIGSTQQEEYTNMDAFFGIIGFLAFLIGVAALVMGTIWFVTTTFEKFSELKTRLDGFDAAHDREETLSRVMAKLNLSEEDAKHAIDVVQNG